MKLTEKRGARLLLLVCAALCAILIIGSFLIPSTMIQPRPDSVGPGGAGGLFLGMCVLSALIAAVAALLTIRAASSREPSGPQVVVGPLMLVLVGTFIFMTSLLVRAL